ncbi:hypothetical protein L0Z65_12400 [Phaeobacter sp. BS52]|uniref:hypothetical protein n=1 Tax=Phaeobacter sp. BS52 TaxID=2907241 RepID=UPI00386DECF1
MDDQLCRHERIDLAGCDVAAKRMLARHPIGKACAHQGFLGLRFFAVLADILDVGAPVSRLKPVAEK